MSNFFYFLSVSLLTVLGKSGSNFFFLFFFLILNHIFFFFVLPFPQRPLPIGSHPMSSRPFNCRTGPGVHSGPPVGLLVPAKMDKPGEGIAAPRL